MEVILVVAIVLAVLLYFFRDKLRAFGGKAKAEAKDAAADAKEAIKDQIDDWRK